MKRNLYVGAGLAALAGALGVASVLLEKTFGGRSRRRHRAAL